MQYENNKHKPFFQFSGKRLARSSFFLAWNHLHTLRNISVLYEIGNKQTDRHCIALEEGYTYIQKYFEYRSYLKTY